MKPMNLFQPMERIREWTALSPTSAMSMNPEYVAQVQADALYVLNRHDLLHRMADERERHIWYRVGTEANGNEDISWRERAEEMESRLNKALEVLTLIATPARPDGTYNRDRKACELLAKEIVEAIEKLGCPS